MPRYFFHVISGEIRQTDAEGKELPGDQSAFDHVISGLQGAASDAIGQADQRQRLSCRSRDRTWETSFSRFLMDTSPSFKRERAENQGQKRGAGP